MRTCTFTSQAVRLLEDGTGTTFIAWRASTLELPDTQSATKVCEDKGQNGKNNSATFCRYILKNNKCDQPGGQLCKLTCGLCSDDLSLPTIEVQLDEACSLQVAGIQLAGKLAVVRDIGNCTAD